MAQYMDGLLHCRGTLLTPILFCVHQDLQVCFGKAAFQPVDTQSVLLCRFLVSQVQEFAFVEPHVVSVSSFLQPLKARSD